MTAPAGDGDCFETCQGHPAASGAGTYPDGRCSGDMCWYTLPVVDGLVVAHSKAGTVDDCEGAGRPPLAPAPAAAEGTNGLREALYERLRERFTGQPISFEFNLGPSAATNLAHLAVDELADLIRERDEAVARVAAFETAKGRPAHFDDDLTVTSEDELVVISFEVIP